MGLFSRKTQAERQAEGMRMADDMAEGRGLMGAMGKAFMGSEFTQAMQQATSSMRQGQRAQTLLVQGAPTTHATVLAVQDTGQTINDAPNVVMTLDLGGQQTALQTLVSRLEIPRAGDVVQLVQDPATGGLLYAGLAPR